MTPAIKRQILTARIELLRAHVEHVGNSPLFERELARAQAELQAIEQRKDQPR